MKNKILGRTGWPVSILSMGTVELGINYGIRSSREIGFPSEPDAIRLVRAAVEAGVNMFDTAPVYGTSETILGKTLADNRRCYIATKVSFLEGESMPRGTVEHEKEVMVSLERSMYNLQREVLDIVQIHNATIATFESGILPRALQRAKDRKLVRFIGASVYDEDAALAAIESGNVDVLQIPFSILDQRLAEKVLPAAKAANVGVIGRSILLKGALTPRARYFPAHLTPLHAAADRVRNLFDISWEELPTIAIRFCLGIARLHTLLVGVRTQAELDDALAAVEAGPLSEVDMASASDLKLNNKRLLNPSYWRIP